MPLIDMKLSPNTDDTATRDAYPRGLCLRLEDEQIRRLPRAVQDALRGGRTVRLEAEAEIVDYSERPMQDGTTQCTAELQITALDIVPDADETREDEGYERTARLLAPTR